MRINVAVLPWIAVCAVACGGATTGSPGSRPRDPCRTYILAMQPAITHMSAAAERYEDSVERGPASVAAAARELAGVIEHERAEVVARRFGRDDIDAEHAKLMAAMAALASSYRGLADGLASHSGTEAARVKMHAAEDDFAAAATQIRVICPAPGK